LRSLAKILVGNPNEYYGYVYRKSYTSEMGDFQLKNLYENGGANSYYL